MKTLWPSASSQHIGKLIHVRWLNTDEQKNCTFSSQRSKSQQKL